MFEDAARVVLISLGGGEATAANSAVAQLLAQCPDSLLVALAITGVACAFLLVIGMVWLVSGSVAKGDVRTHDHVDGGLRRLDPITR
jgi:hypothetical protein